MIGSTVRIVSSSRCRSASLRDRRARPRRGARRREGDESGGRRLVACLGLATDLPARQAAPRARSSSAATSAARSSFSGLGMLTVTTIDLAKGLAPVDSTAVMTDGRIVYASPTSLYVATEPGRPGRSPRRRPSRRARARPRSAPSTSLTRPRPATSAAAPCPATCSASGRCRSSRGCCASSAPNAGVVGQPALASQSYLTTLRPAERRARPGRPARRARPG